MFGRSDNAHIDSGCAFSSKTSVEGAGNGSSLHQTIKPKRDDLPNWTNKKWKYFTKNFYVKWLYNEINYN